MSATPTRLPVTRKAAHAAPRSGAAPVSLELLLESTGEGIYGIDIAGCCTFVNRAAAQMIGHRTEAVLGRNMHELIHHSHADGRHYPEQACPILNAFRAGLPCRIDGEVLWRADGSSFPAEYSSCPIVEAGRVRGAVVTFIDITDRKRAEAQLRIANEKLELRVAERTRELTERTRELSEAVAQLREMSAHFESVREQERRRIAREIHDELGSLLVALKMDVNWLANRMERALLASKCQSMGRLIDTAVDNVGRIITDLRPSILDHQGLWAALEWQAQEFIDSSELKADLQVVVAAGGAEPQGAQAIAVFRVFQEMLSNVARHAKAKSVRIRIVVEDDVLYLEVQDDGIGATARALDDPHSYGVLGMRERAGHFGGRLTIRSAPHLGTSVRLVMPLEKANR